MQDRPVICIVGLGYVGLPLAHAFAAKGYEVHGYDVNKKRVGELQSGKDNTGEIDDDKLQNVTLNIGDDPSLIGKADIVIVALPTPIDDQKKPDLTILKQGTETVGKHMKKGAIIVFESTVYPGTTEEICGSILEEASGMKCGQDFFLGYSPERINPGDKEHTVTKILKIVSGQDEQTLKTLCDVYGDIITAGIHPAPSIQVAEMAKAIENAQRDLNIAFVNEIAMLCGRIGIGTKDVLEAAGTKWNFLKFQPGLVGGHCIGVDPYYLVEKARMLGMETHVITAGRSVNDGMGAIVASQITEALNDKVNGARVLVLGLTFKENVPDTRNSKVKDVVIALEEKGCEVIIHDPFYSKEEVESMNGYKAGSLEDGPFDAIAFLVPHKEYLQLPLEKLLSAINEGGIIYDLKGLLNKADIENTGRRYLAL